MFKIFRKELDWGGTPLVMETGKVARQADGAVMVSLGGTSVLCTAVAAQSPKPTETPWTYPPRRNTVEAALRDNS